MMLKLNNENTIDFGITKRSIIRVQIQEYKDLGFGEDRTYYKEFLTEGEMNVWLNANLSGRVFLEKIEECIEYRANKICIYCINYNCQRCNADNRDIDWNDISCDKFIGHYE